MTIALDRTDRLLLNDLQEGFPIVSRPFREVALRLGMTEDEVISRVRRLLKANAVNRLGPVINLKAAGGERTLAATRVPTERIEEVAALVNSFDAVSHNYQREHEYNVWFVVSSDDPAEVERVLGEIERRTGLPLLELPSLEEYHLGVRFRFEVE